MPALGRLHAVILLIPILTACSSPSSGPTVGVTDATLASGNCLPWGCDQQARFEKASGFVGQQKGRLAIVVKDRVTGEVWRAGDPQLRSWAGSTPKLALSAVLLEQARAGAITLDQADRNSIDAILHVSDNAAADHLWDKYANRLSMMSRWTSTYGMANASYVDGWPNRWGFVKLTPQDLINLMLYVLETMNPADRSFIVDRMRAVGGPQQWGVWGAGSALSPGVKDGWDYCVEIGDDEYRWVTSTVGFAGPGERYVVAALYDEAPEQDIADGVHVLTDLVATVFGAPVPAPVVVPEDV